MEIPENVSSRFNAEGPRWKLTPSVYFTKKEIKEKEGIDFEIGD